MQINVITLFPEMFSAVAEWGITGRAIKQGLIELDYFNPREFTKDKHRTVDDRPFGGGPGMLMKTEPLIAAIRAAKEGLLKKDENAGSAKVAYLSPQGRVIDQAGITELASRERMIFLCGRYQGIDQRVIDQEVDEEWSIGDFVLSGGELAAMTLIDAVIRLQPGAVGDKDSVNLDSFSNGLLHCPEYTKPQVFNSQSVPDVLLTGDHEAIRKWRANQSLIVTKRKRPELISKKKLNEEEKDLLRKISE
jgi:tRNA (guanine37-N1)-methyltransferase